MSGGLLDGVRVVEVADPLTEYAGHVLAELGAEVALIEPPGGGLTRHRRPYADTAGPTRRGLPFLARNGGKHSLVLDPAQPADRETFCRLAASADGLLLTGGSPWTDALPAGARAVRVTVDDPLGLGPSALAPFAAGGGLSSSGWPHQPPCNAPGWLAIDAAGIYAAGLMLVGLWSVHRGLPAPAYTIPLHEAALAGLTPWTRPLMSYELTAAGQGLQPARLGAGPYPVYECLDGYVRVLTGTPRQWEAWLELLGRPAALTTPEWNDARFRAQNADALYSISLEVTRTRRRDDLFHQGQKLGLTITPVLDPAAFLADPHVAARALIQPLDDPDLGPIRLPRAPYTFSDPALNLPPRPAPALGSAAAPAILAAWEQRSSTGAAISSATPGLGEQHPPARSAGFPPTAAEGINDALTGHRSDPPYANRGDTGGSSKTEHQPHLPAAVAQRAMSPAARSPLPAARPPSPAAPLSGLRVLNLGVGAVVPELASLMALLGADVIKIESATYPDFLRRGGMIRPGGLDASVTFNQLNLGVRSCAVDLRFPEGRDLVLRLAAHCDVVMENMRGGVVAKLGLDYDSIRAVRPDVIYLSSQGLGDGPYGGYQTFGPNLQAFSCTTALWAHPDDPYPAGTTLNHPDHLAGKQALAPLLAALLRRERTGEGLFIDAAQFEFAASLLSAALLQEQVQPGSARPQGNRSPDMAPHGCYPCRDEDEWIALAVADDAAWGRLLALVGDPRLADTRFATSEGRLAHVDDLEGLLSAWTRGFSAPELEERLREAGIAASRIVTGHDLAARADEHHDGIFASLSHPTAGTHWYTGLPFVDGDGRRPALRRPPLLGEHTEEVLISLLGLTGPELSRLAAGGAIGR